MGHIRANTNGDTEENNGGNVPVIRKLKRRDSCQQNEKDKRDENSGALCFALTFEIFPRRTDPSWWQPAGGTY